jgi:purine-binding chemotaxis protein CheW
MTAVETVTSTYCTFHVDDLVFGVDTAVVQEIIRFHELTPVPLAPPAVKGLINLRGSIVTAIDLRVVLNRALRGDGELPLNLVIGVDGHVFSLLVDRIGDVVATAGPPDEPPDTLHGVPRRLITGVHQLEGSLLLVLDVPATVEVVQS